MSSETKSSLRILNIVSARPNVMKVAPLLEEYKKYGNKIDAKLVHTGQHYDYEMSRIFFDELGIPEPDYHLGVGSGTHAEQTAKVMVEFEKVLDAEQPDWMVVVGDVNPTMACTVVAVKKGVKVAHVEAGLRSGDRSMPEEINRILTDSIADLLLTPSIDGNLIEQRPGRFSKTCQVLSHRKGRIHRMFRMERWIRIILPIL